MSHGVAPMSIADGREGLPLIKRTAFIHDGLTLDATLYQPERGKDRFPAVVGANGIGNIKEIGLPVIAEALAAAGIATLLFDYAGFGESEGEPRQHVVPWSQVAQFRTALSYLGSLDGIDVNRLGVWGPSFAGAHALHLAATEPLVQCAVALVPFVEVTAEVDPALIEAIVADVESRSNGGDYGTIPLMGFGDELSLLHADGADELLQSWGSEMGLINEITLASLIDVGAYRPLDEMERFNVPVRAILATDDTINPANVTRAALKPFPEVDIVEIPGGHFSVLLEQADAATTATVEWFARHL